MTEQETTPNDNAPGQTPEDMTDSEPITFAKALEILEKGKFDEEHGAIRWSSNYTFLTSITHDNATIMGVYKPQRGERPLWDFPDGTLLYRERASFITSEMLDWQIVPPTVLRDGPRGIGSLQFYVDHDPEYHYFNFDQSLLPQLSRLALFDYLVNNADRKGGHCIVDAQGHLWGIDHGITFHSANKLRTVVWNFAGDAVPQPLLDDVEKLCTALNQDSRDYGREMRKLLNEPELRAFNNRILRILNTRQYPSPGAGPNYPWPPV